MQRLLTGNPLENGTSNIQNLEIPQLQAMVSRYPWFSYAREVLLYKLVGVEPECLESNYKENLIFFPRRDAVLLRCRRAAAEVKKGENAVHVPVKELLDTDVVLATDAVEDAFEIDFSSIQQEAESFVSSLETVGDMVVEVADGETADDSMVQEDVLPDKTLAAPQKIYIVGGDYFSKEDFAQLDDSERVAEIRLGAPADNVERVDPVFADGAGADFEQMDFVTETLAAIYADQGYYDKAIEVYAKLILLYPEKSAYFASLVNEIKSKN